MYVHVVYRPLTYIYVTSFTCCFSSLRNIIYIVLYLPVQIVEIAQSLNLGQRESVEAILGAAEDWSYSDDEIKVQTYIAMMFY